MKNIHCSIISMFCITLILSSCIDTGGDLQEAASTYHNKKGWLATPVPIDYDDKLGYKTILIVDTNEEFDYVEAWIPLPLWKNLPTHSKNKIHLNYIEFMFTSCNIKERSFNICVSSSQYTCCTEDRMLLPGEELNEASPFKH